MSILKFITPPPPQFKANRAIQPSSALCCDTGQTGSATATTPGLKMLKPISPVKPLLAAIVVASGAHATASEATPALLSKTKANSSNTIDSVLKQDVKTITQSQHRRLEKAWQLVIQQLHQTANSSRWGTIMYRSFGVDLTVAETLRQSWARNNFAGLPAVEIADLSKVVMLSKSTNKRAIAAYSSVDNRIYLSQQLLDNATAKQLAKVWLEEIGHSIDNRFNQIDTIGDEGAIFAKLITDSNTESLEQDSDQLELQVMQASNDQALLPVENQYRPVELATIEVGGTCSLNDAIISANSDTATRGCSAGSGADEITFDSATDGTLITMTHEAAIGSDLTITGNGMSPTTVIQADVDNRHFQLVEAGSPSATIANLTLTGGSPSAGSGGSIIVNEDASLTLDRVEIANSTTSGNNGGAIRSSGTLNIHNSYLHHNTTTGRGGAVFVDDTSNAFISSTLIANNSASRGGGINVYAYEAGLTTNFRMINSTVYSNSATTHGGNIRIVDIYGYVNADIVNSTISHGSAPSGRGGNIYAFSNGYVGLTLLNTIVANNVMGDDCDINSGTDFNLVNSLVEDGCEGIDTETNLVTGDPMLGALADNGGLWPTMALLTGSPAIDAGTATSSITFSEVRLGVDLNGDGDATDTGLNIEDIAYDARGTGFARVVGTTIDIGAFEFGSGGTAAPTIPLRWDIDGNGVSEMTDGSLVLRYLYGFRGDVLIADAIGTGASLTTAVQIEPAIQALIADNTLDIDGNGNVNAFDGSLLLRYLRGYTGQTLINRAIGQGATRSNTATITAYIELPD